MSGNTNPQFTAIGNVGSALLTAQLTTSDGSSGTIGTNISVCFTAGANGSYVESARVIPVANAALAAAATVVRFYVSSLTSGATSTANTWLVGELAIQAVNADALTAATGMWDFPLGFRLPASWTILASLGTAANANTGYRTTIMGGDY